MIVVSPMPQEIAVAHAGRMALLNGYESQVAKRFAARSEQVSEGAGGLPLISQLALLCGMGITDYARQHSMLPVLRVAMNSAPCLHGRDASLTRLVGARLHIANAQLCPECVREDLSHWHFSWFRRTHNLEGIETCPVHGVGLHRVIDCNPWTKLPHHWLEMGKTEAIVGIELSVGDTQFQSRMHDVYGFLLERSGPYAVGTIRRALARRASELGLRTSRTCSKPLLSEFLRDCAPPAWIERHLPQLDAKSEGTYFAMLDRLPTSSITPGTGFAYALALAVLFDRVEDAGPYLSSSEANPVAPIVRTNQKEKYPPTFWHGQFWEICVSKMGNVSAIADHLGLQRTYVAEWMERIGFPSFKGVNSASRWKAFSRFFGGESLLVACREEGVDLKELEGMLRIASMPLARMKTAMQGGPENQRKRAIDGDAQQGAGSLPASPLLLSTHD